MISKNDVSLISSLRERKYRQKYKLFSVEGIKSTKELLKSHFKIKKIFCTKEAISLFELNDVCHQVVKEKELRKISFLNTPSQILALCYLPESKKQESFFIKDWALALDCISDPGNLGTIIRLADWFGIAKIYVSKNTVDFFNPKVIQSSMGSFTRIEVVYLDLEDFFTQCNHFNLPIYGAFTSGKSIYEEKFPAKGILLLGSESHGISDKLKKYVSKKITIPTHFPNAEVESLNVATATSILLSYLRKP